MAFIASSLLQEPPRRAWIWTEARPITSPPRFQARRAPSLGFGASVVALGDVDDDGVCDVAVGAPKSSLREGSPGSIHVFSGIDGHRIHVRRGVGLGRSIVPVGDQDADGAADLVATSFEPERSYRLVQVLSGRTGCTMRELQDPFESERSTGSGFGASVAGGVDLDGDGIPDVLIGAPRVRAGAVVAVSGRDGREITRIAGNESCPEWERGFGGSVCSLGDVDGDGRTDFAVRGSSQADEGEEGFDFVRLISGASMKTLGSARTDPYDMWAHRWGTITSAGDLDADGANDLAVVEPDHRVLLLSGKNGRTLREILAPDGELAGFGDSIAEVGDLDRDGLPDLAIGCSDLGSDSSEDYFVQIRSGRDGALLVTYDTVDEPVVVAAGSDWDGDGVPEVLLGFPGLDQVLAVSGRREGLPEDRWLPREEWNTVRVFAPPASGSGSRW